MTAIDHLLSALADGHASLVDLTAPLSPATPVLQLPEPFVNTIPFTLAPVSDFDAAGPAWSWNNIHTGEHTGTHIDAPAHWITGRGGKTVDQIEPGRLVGPVVVLDVRAEVEQDPDFLLEPAHIGTDIAAHGPIPDGAWLLLRTGWSSRNHDQARFLNADGGGSHTPGVSVAGAQWLASSAITGFGVETVGIDAGLAGGFDPGFPVHHHILGADKYGLTQLQNLDRLPPRGALLVVAPLPIVGGTGSPVRALAIVPAGSD